MIDETVGVKVKRPLHSLHRSLIGELLIRVGREAIYYELQMVRSWVWNLAAVGEINWGSGW